METNTKNEFIALSKLNINASSKLKAALESKDRAQKTLKKAKDAIKTAKLNEENSLLKLEKLCTDNKLDLEETATALSDEISAQMKAESDARKEKAKAAAAKRKK